MGFFRSIAMAVAVAAVALAGMRTTAEAQPAQAPSATIQIEIVKAGFIIGGSVGTGTLFYQGQAYPLTVGGVSIGATIGISSADFVGEVYNLYSPYDIAGIYSATQSSYAVAGGSAAAILQNSRGVELHVRGKQVGLEFSVDLSGMSITLR